MWSQGCFLQYSPPLTSCRAVGKAIPIRGAGQRHEKPQHRANVPHQEAAGEPLVLAIRLMADATMSGLHGYVTLSLSCHQHLSCAFVPPRILSCLLPHEEQWFYPHAKFLKTPCNISFLALSAATRYGDLPSEPYPCANLPLLKQKRDGHRMTRCFPLVNWNFVFPDSCWAGLPVSLYAAQMSQACVLPGRSCVPG